MWWVEVVKMWSVREKGEERWWKKDGEERRIWGFLGDLCGLYGRVVEEEGATSILDS